MPDEFWSLTLYEFLKLEQGYIWRVNEKKKNDAWLLANLLQPHSKQTLRPEMFTGEYLAPGETRKMSQEEYEEFRKHRDGD